MSLMRKVRFAWKDDKLPFYFIALATLILIVFTFSRRRVTTNPRSRIITIERVLDAGTLAHKTPNDSSTYSLSKDMVKIGENYYSSKPPLYIFIMIAEVWPFAKINGGTFPEHDWTYIRYLTLLNQVFPYIFMLILALLFSYEVTKDPWTRRFLILALSFGSLAFAYAVTINNHTPAAVLWFIGFYLIWKILIEKKHSWKNFLWLGIISGTAMMLDLSSSFIGILFFIMVLIRNWKKALVASLLALIPVFINLWGYYKISGDWMPFYLRDNLYHYPGSPWNNREGIDSLSEPWWLYSFNTLFAHHGLFYISPVLILGALGLFLKRKKRPKMENRLFWGIGISIILIIALITKVSSNYGGICIGMRWYIPFMPILIFAGIPLIENLSEKLWGKIVSIVLLILSILPNIEALYWEAFIQSSWEKWWYMAFGQPW